MEQGLLGEGRGGRGEQAYLQNGGSEGRDEDTESGGVDRQEGGETVEG